MMQNLSAYIQPGRVRRQIYTDPAIFDLEMERIFGNTWIYIGHESQVKKPGDYFRTFIGRKPVVLVRDAEGVIRVIATMPSSETVIDVVMPQENGYLSAGFSSSPSITVMTSPVSVLFRYALIHAS